MGLSEKKIIKNYEKFCSTGEKYGFLTDELKLFLGADIINAPANPNKDNYNAFDGGLIAHTLLVTKYAISLNEILPESIRVDVQSLIKVCLLHQIGKVRLFTPCKSEWHKEHQGKMYDFNKELTAMRIGERSVFYVISNGGSLTETEFQAIINFDKPNDDKMSKWYSSTLSLILKQANELAIREEEVIE